jgi:hypothetical protein
VSQRGIKADLYIVLESFVVLRTGSQLAVNKAYELNSSTEAELLVAGPVNVLIEPIAETVFLQIEAGDKFIVAAQRNLILQFHTMNNGVDALFVELGEAHAEATEEEMAGVLCVVQIVGIIHDTFNVTLIVTDRHAGFKNVFHIAKVIIKTKITQIIHIF